MKRIVLTTSTSCLDYLNVNHNIRSIHQHLTINNVSFLDGHNISIDKLQKMIWEHSNTTMSTAPASDAEVLQILHELNAQNYDEVLIITHSARLSQSFEMISRVKDQFLANTQTAMKIWVLDSKQVNFAQGIMALDANEMFLNGQSISKIEQHLTLLNNHHQALFVVDDLSYLIKSKRLSAPAGFFANLFDIKPMLEIQKDGKIEAVQKVRKIERAIQFMVDGIGDLVGDKYCLPYLLNAGNPNLVEYTKQVIHDRLGLDNVLVTPVSPTSVATHGPNTVGFGVFVKYIPNSGHLFQHQ